MGFFSKSPTIETEAAPALSPQERYQQSCDELRTVGMELRAAEKTLRLYLDKNFNGKDPRIAFINQKMFVQLNAMTRFPQLLALEKEWARLFQKQQAAIRECARLKKEAGLTH